MVDGDEAMSGSTGEVGDELDTPQAAVDSDPDGQAEGQGDGQGDGQGGDVQAADRTDGAGASEPDGRDPLRFNEWRKRSATGVVMSGIALGLREALELPDQRPAIVVDAPGEPDDPDRPIDLHFDPDDPAGTVAVVRHRDGGASTGPDRRP